MYTGPHIITDGLVFGYDADDRSSRFYPGEPTDNILRNFTSNTLSYPSNIYRCTSIETNIIDTKAPNGQYSRFTGIDGSSNNQVFYSYGSIGLSSVLGKTITFSVYLKGNGTCHLTTYDNSRGYGTSSTITLTNNWVKHSYTRSISSSATNYWSGVRGILSTTDVYVASSSSELNSHATQFTSTSRSATQALIDLKKATTIDVSNVSFDSTAHPIFDGTDDRIVSSTGIDLSSYTSLTYEGVVKASGISSHDRWFSGTSGTAFHNPDLAIGANGQLRYIFSNGGVSSWVVPAGVTVDTTKFSHLVYTFTNSGLVKVYVNGVLKHTATHSSGTFPSDSRFMTGSRFDINGEAVVGSIPITKIYGRALTAGEVKQNFNAYKNRFNL